VAPTTEGFEAAAPDLASRESASRVEQDLKFLVRAAEVLSSTLDPRQTLQNVAELLIESLADWSIVYSIDEHGKLVREACAHRNPELLGTLEQFCAFPIDAAADQSVGAAVREERLILFPVIDPSILEHAVEDSERAQLLKKLAPISCVIAPLSYNNKVLGAVTCSRATNPLPFDEADATLLRTIGIRMAMAVDNARLFRRARRAEDILQDVASGLEQVLYVSSTSPFSIDLVSPAYEKIFGRPVQSLYDDPTSFMEAIHPNDRQLVEEALGRQLQNQATEVDYRVIKPDGTLRWVRDRSFPKVAEGGNVSRVVGIVEDITESRRRELELKFLALSGEVLSSSLDYMTTLQNVAQLAVPEIATWCAIDVLTSDGVPERVAVAHVDPEKIRWAREVHEKYPTDMDAPTGMPQVIRSGQPELYSVIPEELIDMAARDEEHRHILKSAEIRSVIIVPLSARGSVYGTISFISDEPGRYDERSLGLAMELARRAGQAVENSRVHASVEQQVEERTAELRAVNRELEAFTYSVSHDLRAPLRSIVANARMLAEDFGSILPPEAHDYLQGQEDAAKRLAQLIDELLQLSRLRKVDLMRVNFDLTELVRQVAKEILRPEAAERLELQIQEDLQANGDPRLVRIVIQNLLENAIKFSPSAGVIQIGSEDGAYFVRDQGIGFPMEFVQKLFLPFERLVSDDEFEGTGIGLASVQRVVHRHGGRVWASSEPGKGATFYFTLD
jgi:PAS domain S-box-containing protein